LGSAWEDDGIYLYILRICLCWKVPAIKAFTCSRYSLKSCGINFLIYRRWSSIVETWSFEPWNEQVARSTRDDLNVYCPKVPRLYDKCRASSINPAILLIPFCPDCTAQMVAPAHLYRDPDIWKHTKYLSISSCGMKTPHPFLSIAVYNPLRCVHSLILPSCRCGSGRTAVLRDGRPWIMEGA